MQTSVPDEGNLRTRPGGLKGTASIISPAAQPRRTWRSIAHTDRSRHAAGISTAAKLATAPQVAGFEHLRRAGFEKAQPVSVSHLHAAGKTPSRSARFHHCRHAHDMDRSGLWAGLSPARADCRRHGSGDRGQDIAWVNGIRSRGVALTSSRVARTSSPETWEHGGAKRG